MKKFFTLIAASAATFSMMAANFQVYFRGEPVQNGDTYKTGYAIAEEYDEGGWKSIDWKQDSHLTLHGDQGMGISVTVTLTEGYAQWCGVSGQCTDMKVNTATASQTRQGTLLKDGADMQLDNVDTNYTFGKDGLPVQIAGKDTPNFPTVKAVITAQEINNDASKVTIYLEMLNLPDEEVKNMGAVNSAIADSSYIRMTSGNTLNYNIEGQSTLSVYAITGNQVGRYSIAGAGTLNLSSLPKGIYIYTDGQHKGKFLIK